MSFLFFFTDTAPTEIYTLSLHDALPISEPEPLANVLTKWDGPRTDVPDTTAFVVNRFGAPTVIREDRKSTRLNSSHEWISYAVFCLKKKNKKDPRSRYNARGECKYYGAL